ncbi:MAG: hypothetical protein GEU78_16905 [Actinobacteria bacterium]|nr:hypothetical protein [Actinomycetota bacterium]
MLGRTQLNQALEALAAQLEAKGKRRELVVIGGSGLIALGLIERPTRDVDVVALASQHGLEPADPLPADLREAAQRVAADLDLEEKWLTPSPPATCSSSAYPKVSEPGSARRPSVLL